VSDADLRRARIEVLDAQGRPKEELPVQFKPTEYSIEKSVTHGDQRLPGSTLPITQFVSGDAETLSMELFFDTYPTETTNPGAKADGPTDVREYTDRIDGLMKLDPDRGEPPVCRFVWGSLLFTSVVESASKQFTMFLPSGVPVRARVNITFKRYAGAFERRTESSGQTVEQPRMWVVKQGDTLWDIAATEYGDPYAWRDIASANGIENPRTLQIGTELVLPKRGA
jgi:hypothetical protein